MDALEDGKNKLGQICDLLRKDTLEPAQNEANKIVEDAKVESQKIIDAAKAEAQQQLDQAKAQIDQERKLFESSMDLGAKQTFDQLKERVQSHLFNEELGALSQATLEHNDLVAKLVSALVTAIEKEGIHSNLTIALGKSISPEEVSKSLAANIAEKIKANQVSFEEISSGAKISLKDQKVSVDISDASLKELFGSFLRDSFREILFKNV